MLLPIIDDQRLINIIVNRCEEKIIWFGTNNLWDLTYSLEQIISTNLIRLGMK